MSSPVRLAGAVLLALAALAGLRASFFTVEPGRAVVVMRAGAAQRLALPGSAGSFAGLHARWPLLEQAVEYDLRPQVLRLHPVQGRLDGRESAVRAYLRYRIADPWRLARDGDGPFQASSLQARAEEALRRASDVGVGDAQTLRRATLDALRRTSRTPGLVVEDLQLLGSGADEGGGDGAGALDAQAAAVEAEGEAVRRTAIAVADREAADIRSDAQGRAIALRGEGDAQRTRILGAAYAADPDFARFFRRLEAYDQALDPQTTTLVLGPDNAFLRIFNRGPDAER